MNTIREDVKTMIESIPMQVVPNAGDYYGSDGLLRCGDCGKPKELRIKIFGIDKTVHCMCECEIREDAETRARLEQEEQMLYIKRLRTNGLQDRLLQKCRFDDSEYSRALSIARKYAENWNSRAADNAGLLFWGPVGTGKSFIAACIANALIEKSVPVLMTSFPKIMNSMGSIFSADRQKYLSSFQKYHLLIIDDLGVERSTEYTQEMVYQLIDERYKTELPLIITTNKTWDEIKNPKNVGDARIFSRIREMCVPVFVGGDDKRESKAEAKLRRLKEIIE